MCAERTALSMCVDRTCVATSCIHLRLCNVSIATHPTRCACSIRKYYSSHFSMCACHPCAGAMLIVSVSFQFWRMIPEGNPGTIRTYISIRTYRRGGSSFCIDKTCCLNEFDGQVIGWVGKLSCKKCISELLFSSPPPRPGTPGCASRPWGPSGH